MKTLYIVATPIGNLADISFRAVETLKSVDFIVAEDTRHTGILLKKHDIEAQLISFHAQSADTKSREIFARMDDNSAIAYVSDAGTPGISDPGYRLVREAIQQGIKVVPIPGPSALTTFLSAAGLPTDSFIFYGFLPHKKGRQTILQECRKSDRTSVFYESVHRFPKLLKELSEILDNSRIIVVGRELTKMHEEFFRGNLVEAIAHFTKENTKGEFVVAISPRDFSFQKTSEFPLEKGGEGDLLKSREKIDQIDAELLKLLAERMKISRKIAQIKQKAGLPKYIPEREVELIANLQNLNDSKLRDSDIEKIWLTILEISRGEVEKDW